MFAELGCDFALWGDPFRPLHATGEEEAEDLEHSLPISESLRLRLLAWAGQYQYLGWDGGERNSDMSDFDEQGMRLSRDLQRELGSEYSVRYAFAFAGSKERLLPLVADEPCPGWRAR